jgi:hypothetical protein
MNLDRLEGKAKEMKGKAKEKVGRATGDDKMRQRRERSGCRQTSECVGQGEGRREAEAQTLTTF